MMDEKRSSVKEIYRGESVQVYDFECLLPDVKYGGGSVITCAVAGPIVILKGYGIFRDDNAPIYAPGLVQLGFDEHEEEVEHLPWSIHSPNLNIF
ncbi:hypothetical protein TNCV_614261 [Trichonephila clavipes]|nr:hypothetical protein TNCV_614261 [Trichonephila clavipes]